MADATPTAVITGGARGIGLDLAAALAGDGFAVAICSRTSTDVESAVATITAIDGGRALGAVADVADPGAMSAFARRVEAELGSVDLLVNNAAVLGPVGRIDRVDLERWRNAIDVNVAGVANTCSAFGPGMLRRGSGSIVNLSGGGTGGPRPSQRMSAYSASKAALVVLSEVLALELAPIRVNAVAPGAMPTGFMREVTKVGPSEAGEELHEMAERQLREPGKLDDFIDLVRFLASPESSWLTGRLLSARWDQVSDLRQQRSEIEPSGSLLRLRRIDGQLFGEL